MQKKNTAARKSENKIFVGYLECRRVGENWVGTQNLFLVAGSANFFAELHSLQRTTVFFLALRYDVG